VRRKKTGHATGSINLEKLKTKRKGGNGGKRKGREKWGEIAIKSKETREP